MSLFNYFSICETYCTLSIAAVSMLAFFHSTHDLHQLKKVCSQQRSNAVRSMHYTM